MSDSSRRTNVLFVCSKNRWRSPTAEAIYQRDERLNVRSCGTSRDARQTIRLADISWADLVLVMEHKHKQRILAAFPDAMKFKSLHVLDVPDEYQYMDCELVEMLRVAVDALLPDT